MKIRKQETEQVENKNIKAIDVINFSKKYKGGKRYAVKDASFHVSPGEFHGFIGANGAGKTTSIKSIIGAYAKFQGKVLIHGINNKKKEAKKHIGYIPEKADFPAKMSLKSYLELMAEISGKTTAAAKKFAKEQIQELGLQGVANRSPNGFSSGQKKKVLLAQALVSDPDVLIMDEPAANLDPKARYEFFSELKKLQRMNKTIFLSSHILSELDKFVTHITILDNGKVVYTGPVKPLVTNKDLRYIFKLKDSKDHDRFMELARKLGANKTLAGKKSASKKIIRLSVHNEQTLFKVVAAAMKAKIHILEYSEIKLDLQHIYNRFVKIGSVDTPESLKKGGKK